MIQNQIYERPGFLISTDKDKLDLDVIYQYLADHSYWWKPEDISHQKVVRFVQHSLCFGVYDMALHSTAQQPLKQVGFARAVTDYTTFAYLADLFILPVYQGRGLGKWLVQSILAHSDMQGLRRWTLATADAHTLYAQFGFVVDPTPEKNMVFRPSTDP